MTANGQTPTAMKTNFGRAAAKEFAFLKDAETLEQLFARAIALPRARSVVIPFARVHLDTAIAAELENAWGATAQQLLDGHAATTFLVLDRANSITASVRVAAEADRFVFAGFHGRADAAAAEAVAEITRWAEDTLWPEAVVAGRQSLTGFFTSDISLLPLVDPSSHSGECCQLSKRASWRGGENVILTAGPSVSSREAAYALDAAKYGWNDQWAKYLKRFEQSFAEYVGVKYALATSSCTGALHLSLLALGVGPGDEVIVPDITWVATANAVLYVGATPVFADVDPQTWCLDPRSFRAMITPRTKAVMPVHLYGHPCQMDEIMRIAQEHGLFVVEDAAPSIGAEFDGRRTGSFGHFAAFSFQGAKLAVTGEGGMLVTSDENLYKRVYTLWDQGRIPGTFWIGERGWKYKMANMLAAFGLGQLERNDEMVAAKRRIFGWYSEGLADVPHLSLNAEGPGARSIYWMTSVRLHDGAPIDRDSVISRLKERKIDSRPVFPAISQYPIWPVKQPPQPNAERIGRTSINLPSGVCLSRREVDFVCATLRDLMTR